MLHADCFTSLDNTIKRLPFARSGCALFLSFNYVYTQWSSDDKRGSSFFDRCSTCDSSPGGATHVCIGYRFKHAIQWFHLWRGLTLFNCAWLSCVTNIKPSGLDQDIIAATQALTQYKYLSGTQWIQVVMCACFAAVCSIQIVSSVYVCVPPQTRNWNVHSSKKVG